MIRFDLLLDRTPETCARLLPNRLKQEYQNRTTNRNHAAGSCEYLVQHVTLLPLSGR